MEQGLKGKADKESGAVHFSFLNAPEILLETYQPTPGIALVELLWVPEHLRRQGLGAKAYQSWEMTLSEGSRVELYAVDAEAEIFWRSVGFVHVEHCDRDHVGGHMIKTVARQHEYQAWQRCGEGFSGEENITNLSALPPLSV